MAISGDSAMRTSPGWRVCFTGRCTLQEECSTEEGGLILYVGIGGLIPDAREGVLVGQLDEMEAGCCPQSCVCPALRATAVRCKCGVDGLKQGGVIEWFGEEGYRARLQRLGSHGFIPVRRYKDNGNTGLARAQLPLQLQATAPWQPHIEEQTRRRVHLPRLEEGLRGGEGLGPPAYRAQETGEGVTDRLLIIDNRDQRGLGHAYLPGLVCVLFRPMPSSGKRITQCGKAATIRWYR